MAIDQTSSHSDENSHHHGLIGMILDVAVRFRWAIIVLTIFAAIYDYRRLPRACTGKTKRAQTLAGLAGKCQD